MPLITSDNKKLNIAEGYTLALLDSGGKVESQGEDLQQEIFDKMAEVSLRN